MSWDTALADLRTVLDEGSQDKLAYRKRCLGDVNGVNTSFKTFDNRRETDFTTVSAPLGVWVNGTLLAASGVTTDYPTSGDFVLAAAPANGEYVEASYYYRWFLDTELEQFLVSGSEWLALGSDYTQVSEGLRPGALKYAASEAYQKLAVRLSRRLSEGFMLNDAPAVDTVGKMVTEYGQIALKYREDAEKVRDDFYSRSGQQKQPLFGFVLGRIKDNVPKQ
ncbi:MAG TPA: hypothetical protein DGG95_00630 [Cytophagales bacterium]|jgi:hypothetical protein|nr:hypothetical protein [Cytophagales bacterium]